MARHSLFRVRSLECIRALTLILTLFRTHSNTKELRAILRGYGEEVRGYSKALPGRHSSTRITWRAVPFRFVLVAHSLPMASFPRH
jgi:hypothetical protein